MRFARWALLGLFVSLLPCHAWAQSTSTSTSNPPLARLLVEMLVRSVSMPSTTSTVAGNPHEAHFLPGLAQKQAPFEINKAIVGQLGTFPIGSSSGGFSATLNPSTGLFDRASQNFGPGFAERALTNGRGRFGLGANFQRLTFKSFEGAPLNNVSALRRIPFVLQHNDCCPGQNPVTGAPGGDATDPKDPAFEGDLVDLFLSVDVKTAVFAPFVNYGVTDRWDIGAVVPIVNVQLSPSILAIMDRVSTGSSVLVHSFDGNGQSVQEIDISGSASGLGDMILRTKFRVMELKGGGFAAGIDLRLPTGDKENLLGTGTVQTKVSLIASQESGPLATHVNFGYTASSGKLSTALTTLTIPSELPGNQTPYQTIFPNGVPATPIDLSLPKEISYTVGVDVAPHPLLTISADVIGRALLDTPRFGMTSQTFSYRTTNQGPLLQTNRNVFDISKTGTLNLILGVVGAKVAIPGKPLLLTGNILFPLSDAGLRPAVTAAFGIDYSFKALKR